ncbi:hypothetical protein BDK51DRAFT_47952 [Blyttiomyces helicus]|uniref:Uncharacterized protein n=1 Tax=Blyttiomyces helicus TaxID=388810 RepID=A0A4P9W3V7_9FUNG|nr:hypothetical protein BDK51DRAFT_47952 [Blyttiomyces helicus]|eukprot:RKO85488.1 hypothetical protein BDK51DRAFT_47952 [Blyttiomyces helicus]
MSPPKNPDADPIEDVEDPDEADKPTATQAPPPSSTQSNSALDPASKPDPSYVPFKIAVPTNEPKMAPPRNTKPHQPRKVNSSRTRAKDDIAMSRASRRGASSLASSRGGRGGRTGGDRNVGGTDSTPSGVNPNTFYRAPANLTSETLDGNLHAWREKGSLRNWIVFSDASLTSDRTSPHVQDTQSKARQTPDEGADDDIQPPHKRQRPISATQKESPHFMNSNEAEQPAKKAKPRRRSSEEDNDDFQPSPKSRRTLSKTREESGSPPRFSGGVVTIEDEPVEDEPVQHESTWDTHHPTPLPPNSSTVSDRPTTSRGRNSTAPPVTQPRPQPDSSKGQLDARVRPVLSRRLDAHSDSASVVRSSREVAKARSRDLAKAETAVEASRPTHSLGLAGGHASGSRPRVSGMQPAPPAPDAIVVDGLLRDKKWHIPPNARYELRIADDNLTFTNREKSHTGSISALVCDVDDLSSMKGRRGLAIRKLANPDTYASDEKYSRVIEDRMILHHPGKFTAVLRTTGTLFLEKLSDRSRKRVTQLDDIQTKQLFDWMKHEEERQRQARAKSEEEKEHAVRTAAPTSRRERPMRSSRISSTSKDSSENVSRHWEEVIDSDNDEWVPPGGKRRLTTRSMVVKEKEKPFEDRE